MKGTFAISGSVAAMFKNFFIRCSVSSIPSSILISIIWAPFSTWLRAISKARSKFSSFTNFLNFAEPVTLVLSPTLTKGISSDKLKGSNPDRRIILVM